MLLGYLGQQYPSFTQTSAGDFIKAIITISANASQNEQSCIGPNSLTRQLVSEACIKSLIADMLKGGNPLTVGVGIIIEVIRKNNSDYDPEPAAGQDTPPSSGDPIYLGALLRLFASHVPAFMALILSSTHTVASGETTISVKRKELQVAFGKAIEPLGFDRFKTCELMAELLHCSNMGLLNERGSEAYIRQRDQEREKLRAEGMFAKSQEARSPTTEFSEDSTVHRNGSNSPELVTRPLDSSTHGKLGATSSAEDDGFEDVGTSGDVADEIRSDFEEKGDFELAAAVGVSPIKPSKSRLSLDDEFFDEPLHSPPRPPNDDGSTAGDSALNADSPSTALASGVDHLEIKSEDSLAQSALKSSAEELMSEIDSHLSPRKPDIEASTLSQQDLPAGEYSSAGGHSPGGLSPHADDTPAPLFAANDSSHLSPHKSPQAEQKEAPQGQTQTPEKEVWNNRESEFAPHIETDVDGRPIVGDYLKMQFVEHKVVPTILVGPSLRFDNR
jgi:SIT4-associating protein SAP185/190